MDVVVLQAEQGHERRTNVGVIGELVVVPAERLDAGAGEGDPGLRDLLLEVAVVPGKAGSLAHGVGRGCAAVVVTRLEEVVVVAEDGERRRALRAEGDHVQQPHLGPVSQQLRQFVGVAGDRVGGGQRVDVMLHGPRERVGRPRIGVDVHVRSIVAVNRERRAVHALREQDLVDRQLDLADILVAARRGYAVAIRRARRAADKMVVLVRHDNKQRVGLVDAISLEAGEEFAKGLIVSLQRRNITGLARAIGMAAVRGGRSIRDVQTLRIVRIGNIRIDNLNAGFEHFCGMAERGGCRRIEVGGEARLVRERIGDHHAIEVRHRTARRDYGLHVDVAVESREAAITAGLIGEKIWLRKGVAA